MDGWSNFYEYRKISTQIGDFGVKRNRYCDILPYCNDMLPFPLEDRHDYLHWKSSVLVPIVIAYLTPEVSFMVIGDFTNRPNVSI
jgi:hypothetical protein